MSGNQTVKQYFRMLQLIHLSLIVGQIIFALAIRYISKNQGILELDPTLITVFEITAFILLLIAFFGGQFLFNSRLKVIRAFATLSDKMNAYRTILIVRYAMLEAPAFFALIAYLLSSNELFLVIVAIVLFIFILLRPTPAMLAKNLSLDSPDADFLNNPDKVIQ